MAADSEVYALRLLVAEPNDELPWTDAKLSSVIDDAGGDLNLAAHNVWTAKAADTAELVNVSEGGSSRSMSDLHQNALRMATHFSKKVSGGTEAEPARTRVHRLTR